MIWEQTINLTQPLRSVRLEIDGDSLIDRGQFDTTSPPQRQNFDDEVSCVKSPEQASNKPAAEDAQPNTDQLLERLVVVLQQQRAAGNQTIQELHIAAIEIATAVVEKLFLNRVSDGEFELERLVNEALAVLQVPPGPVVVRLHPDDVSSLQKADLAIPASDMTLVGDDSIGRGNCQVDGEVCGVRFDWAVQLRELRQRMLRSLMDANAKH